MDGPFAAFRAAQERDGTLAGILAWFLWFGEDAWARRAILAVNAAGIAYGFWYYQYQFSVTPWYYWPFVPDSPLAVLWATGALLLWSMGRRSPALEGLAFAGNVVIGLWTGFVLLFYDRVHWPRLDFFLFFLHLAMVALAFVFVAKLRTGPRRDALVAVGAAALVYGVNVVMDYWWPFTTIDGCTGLHPITIHPFWKPCASLDVVAAVTVGITVAAVGVLASLVLVTRPATRESLARAPVARRR